MKVAKGIILSRSLLETFIMEQKSACQIENGDLQIFGSRLSIISEGALDGYQGKSKGIYASGI